MKTYTPLVAAPEPLERERCMIRTARADRPRSVSGKLRKPSLGGPRPAGGRRMSDTEPLDDNLLKEARFLVWLFLKLSESPFVNGTVVRLDAGVRGYLMELHESMFMDDGTVQRTFGFEQVEHESGAGLSRRWFFVTFRHYPTTGMVDDVRYVDDIEPEDKFWWLMWFSSYLKGRRDILP